MKHIKLIAVIGIAALMNISSLCAQNKEVSLSSPDKNLQVTFRTVSPAETGEQNSVESASGNKLVYDIIFQDKQLISPSAMGVELEGSPLLGENVKITGTTFQQGEDRYQLKTGKTSQVNEKYNSVLISLAEERTNRQLQVEARAYNGAVAFRYIVPEQPGMAQYRLVNEKTEFRLPQDATTYAQVLPNFRSGYEAEFHKVPATGLSNQGGVSSRYLLGLPLVLDMPGRGWVAIAEADLENNAGMYLLNPSGNWTGFWFETVISPSLNQPEVAVVSTLPHKSAWRIIMAANNPGRFIESNVMTSLNPESRIADTSWIKAGKSAWDWWNGSLDKNGKHAYTTENMKYYINFAHEAGLEYMTVDAGWSTNDITVFRENLNVPEVVAYAKEKGVKVFIWAHSRNVWKQMNEAFPLYEKWGVAGIKIDFIERDDQAGIDFYYRVAKKAAEHKLMIDFHGCSKPWGIQRTYPNVVGYEGIIGMEQSKAGWRDNPDNRLMIPFTRMLGGLTDYTPGGFDNVTPEAFEARMESPVVMGTRAHHLAMYVVYESPFQMVSDWPERYRNDSSFEFIKKVPATWDDTRVLNGKPGEYVTIARKSGNDWYVGAMTNYTERNLEVSLSFLETGNYEAEIYADTPQTNADPKKISITRKRVNANSKLSIHMSSAGGMAIYIRKLK